MKSWKLNSIDAFALALFSGEWEKINWDEKQKKNDTTKPQTSIQTSFKNFEMKKNFKNIIFFDTKNRRKMRRISYLTYHIYSCLLEWTGIQFFFHRIWKRLEFPSGIYSRFDDRLPFEIKVKQRSMNSNFLELWWEKNE